MIRRMWPETSVSVYKLRKLYRCFGIKKKAIMIDKSPPVHRRLSVQDAIIELKQSISRAISLKIRIVMLDEMVVTRRTLPSIEWSFKR